MDSSQNRLEGPRLGGKVRALRRRQNLTQVQLAERLGISASYLNLIESNRRPLPAGLLIKLAQQFGVDLSSFATDEDGRLLSDLIEVFADPLFEGHGLTQGDVREMATSSPAAARAVLALYRAFEAARTSTESLAERVAEGEEGSSELTRSQMPSEEVGDFVQARMNYFPELEEGAEELWKRARLDAEELYGGLVRYLEKQHGVHVRVARWGEERGILRRYDEQKKLLVLSELLPTRSRTFQVATQI